MLAGEAAGSTALVNAPGRKKEVEIAAALCSAGNGIAGQA